MELDALFTGSGILHNELKVGVVSTVTAQLVKINLAHAGDVSGSYIKGARYGRGEVGELVLIEGQQAIVLGRVTEVRLPDRDRTELSQDYQGSSQLDAIGYVKLLGSINIENLRIQAGISAYPRLGDRVFSAPTELLSALPQLMNDGVDSVTTANVTINLGKAAGGEGSSIYVTPEKLFGRHCAILGSTGGGKSWTTAKVIEECEKFSGAKVIIIDATSEYRSLNSASIVHYHLGSPLHKSYNSSEIKIPPTDFFESDFIAMFDPSGKVQGPKLKEAIKSLRLASLAPDKFPEGLIRKIGQTKSLYRQAMNAGDNSKLVDDPSQPFDVSKLARQIVEECCWDNDDRWGAANNDLGYCSSLLTRIQAVTYTPSLKAVFQSDEQLKTLTEALEEFFSNDMRVFRLCLSDVSYEFYAREVLANVIGRKLLMFAREERFRIMPLLTVVDEAHNFLGKRVGAEDHSTKLDAFELIAKEGRKYGLNICLTTQRPRDITEGVLSQMGTLLVHRLTNDRDREVVERACGEIDRSAASFLPNLKQGEVAVIGVDFPIPMTIQIDKPITPPLSDGPDFQTIWKSEVASY
ncbi:ATP-binding protein [Billgrantia endophytica]|uniref:Cell division protein FtsK n=1 Tax=Billgrantia endophytica TaxID=2033802 RepID=A0A2N7U4G4_9GAMM|nr:ATP-binding protein [Halomonas endophytica]PMR75318.1 cell division protein FtsK [Halomonas endophytica]